MLTPKQQKSSKNQQKQEKKNLPVEANEESTINIPENPLQLGWPEISKPSFFFSWPPSQAKRILSLSKTQSQTSIQKLSLSLVFSLSSSQSLAKSSSQKYLPRFPALFFLKRWTLLSPFFSHPPPVQPPPLYPKVTQQKLLPLSLQLPTF